MIPKTIHYCWLSGEPYPDEIRRCIDSWREHLSGYEFVLWDAERFDVESLPWTKQAFDAKKYAFAADYIRLHALYRYGGIYLDSDVMVYKSFDDILDLPYFIGQDFTGAFEPAVVGCEPELEWVKKVMEYYEGRNFVADDGTYNIENLPVVFFERLFGDYRFKGISDKEEFCYDEGVFNLFGPDFFNGRDNVGPQRREATYCSHLFAGSWTEGGDRKRFLKKLPSGVLNAILGLNYHLLRRRKVHRYDPLFRQRR